ncbi:MAG: hypothetical protein EXS46_00955 [Candidatus Taylorbacteria bacterium]|nr:hypothetical protein [Candidatus Taylorbacteria bacterium]
MQRAKDPAAQEKIALLLAKAQKTLDKACKSRLLSQRLQEPWPKTLNVTKDGSPALILAGTSTLVTLDEAPLVIFVGFLRATSGTPKLSLFTLCPSCSEIHDCTTSLPVIQKGLAKALVQLSNVRAMAKSIIYDLAG